MSEEYLDRFELFNINVKYLVMCKNNLKTQDKVLALSKINYNTTPITKFLPLFVVY